MPSPLLGRLPSMYLHYIRENIASTSSANTISEFLHHITDLHTVIRLNVFEWAHHYDSIRISRRLTEIASNILSIQVEFHV